MKALWAGPGESALVGLHGVELETSPGDGRYASALQALRASDADVAFAAFTFDPSEEGSKLIGARTGTGSLPSPGRPERGRIVEDGVADWRRAFGEAMESIEEGSVDKIVLARRVLVEMESDLDPFEVALRLIPANPGAYVFAIDDFVGASPELLISLRDGWARTVVLAGTVTGNTRVDTAKLSAEHMFAAESVRAGLRRHLSEFSIDERTERSQGAMTHIATRIEGPVRSGTEFHDLLFDLHPTAAVAGSPTKEAIELINRVEGHPRGLYAGPVGWFDRDGEGVFAVALRCGQIQGRTVDLHAGGGLVAGSDESSELAETEAKLTPMMRALGISDSLSRPTTGSSPL